jgi:histone H3/H4
MIPLAAIERIIRKSPTAGVERISQEALKELEIATMEIGEKLAYEAAEAAKHAKRRTILKEDILLISQKPKI